MPETKNCAAKWNPCWATSSKATASWNPLLETAAKLLAREKDRQMLGRTISRYRVVEKLGAGTVFTAAPSTLEARHRYGA